MPTIITPAGTAIWVPERKKMRELTIGTKMCTTVYAMDEKEFGANHEYKISLTGDSEHPATFIGEVKFQKGPVKEFGRNGIHNEDLIVIVIDRLQGLNETEFKCRENAVAITKLEEALMWLNKRTTDRKRRGVEGTHTV